jgi:hypothetical protein
MNATVKSPEENVRCTQEEKSDKKPGRQTLIEGLNHDLAEDREVSDHFHTYPLFADADRPVSPSIASSKAIAFDVDQDSLISLRKALQDYVIEVVNGATPASLTRDWNPGTVDLFVVRAHKEVAETLALCRFLVKCGVLAKDAPVVTDAQEETPKILGLYRRRRHVGRRAHSPLLVLVSPSQKSIVEDVLKAGAHSCLMLPFKAKDVANMLVHAQAGNQPGRHTLDLERAQTEDRWRDDGGQG